MSAGETAILNKLADIALQQAVTGERLVAVIERLEDHMERSDQQRARSTDELKAFVSTTMKQSFSSSDLWWRRALWIAVGLLALAEITGSVNAIRISGLLKP